MIIGPNSKFLLTYLLIFYLLAGIGAMALNTYKKNHYSKEIMEEMITTPSSLRDTTDNPCKYSIHGDPLEAGPEFVKVNLICQDGQKTVSTISLKAIPNSKFSTILNEYARILGFDPQLLNSWKCSSEKIPITDRDQIVANKSQIICSHPYVKN